MAVHYALSQDTACGEFIGNPDYRLIINGDTARYEDYDVGCIQHTCDKDLVTCKKCKNTRSFKNVEDEDDSFC